MSNGKKPVKIGYWNSRGLVHQIILILEYTETPYIFYVPKCGPAPKYDKSDWMATKHQKLPEYDFPNLPFYQDETVSMTQTRAIMDYLGRKHKLIPTDDKNLENVEMLSYQGCDILDQVPIYTYFPDLIDQGLKPTEEEINAKKTIFLSGIKRLIKDVDRFYIKNGGKWMIGNQLTYADFMLYEAMDHCRLLESTCLDDFPKLKEFMNYFEELPSIKKYIESGRFKRYPLFAERAMLGRDGPGLPKDHEACIWKKEGEYVPI